MLVRAKCKRGEQLTKLNSSWKKIWEGRKNHHTRLENLQKTIIGYSNIKVQVFCAPFFPHIEKQMPYIIKAWLPPFLTIHIQFMIQGRERPMNVG
jgi:hypothetical protein